MFWTLGCCDWILPGDRVNMVTVRSRYRRVLLLSCKSCIVLDIHLAIIHCHNWILSVEAWACLETFSPLNNLTKNKWGPEDWKHLQCSTCFAVVSFLPYFQSSPSSSSVLQIFDRTTNPSSKLTMTANHRLKTRTFREPLQRSCMKGWNLAASATHMPCCKEIICENCTSLFTHNCAPC